MIDPPTARDPRAWLTALEHFGIKLGLASMRAICAELGDPERAFRCLHIAGTNGKGSVAAMADAALRAAGHGVGRYTSPHLIRLEERMTIGGEPVSPEALDAAIDRVRDAVGRLRASGSLDVHPTFFEVTTAAAFLAFARAGVTVAVLEVGLGGRFDATNVVQPVATAITSIALDHEQHLGRTVTSIAFEKAGIVKAGTPVVIGKMPDDAREVIRRIAEERGASIHDASAECAADTTREGGATIVRLTTPCRAYGPLGLGLRGDHQVRNACVAVRLLEVADGLGVAVPGEAIAAGLSNARWPARLELLAVADGREVLVDGAHNPAGATALADYIASEWPGGLPLVFGAMRDKDLAGMLRALAPLARPLVVTTAPGARAASAEELAHIAAAAGMADILVCPVAEQALSAAWDRAPRIAVAGSLFLAGRVLALLRHGGRPGSA